jgi:hypothetical protein
MHEHRVDPFTTSAGPYVLGALSPGERTDFEAHLPACPDCRRAVEELAGLPGLLSRTPREVVDALGEDDPVATLRARGHGAAAGAEAVPDTVLPAVLRTVRQRRTTRRAALAGGLAAAAALVSVLVWPGGEDPAPTAGGGDVQQMDPLLPVPITATVQLTEVGWGTKVDLVCAYAQAAAEEPFPYALVIADAAGTTQQIGTWTAVPGRDAALSGATSWTRDQIATVEVRTLTGTAVLRLTET